MRRHDVRELIHRCNSNSGDVLILDAVDDVQHDAVEEVEHVHEIRHGMNLVQKCPQCGSNQNGYDAFRPKPNTQQVARRSA